MIARTLLSIAAACAALALPLAAPGQSTPIATPADGIRTEPEVQGAVTDRRGHPRRGRARAAKSFEVRLEKPTPAELAQLAPARKGAPLQVGFARAITAARDDAGFHKALAWESLGDGTQVASVSFTSPDAAAVRVGFRVASLSPSLLMRFHAPNAGEMFEVTGEQILETIAQNLDADENSPDANLYWSPVIEGPTLVVELELPRGGRPQDLRLAAPQLSHLVSSPREDVVEKASAACEIDATCHQSTWGAESNAVARMIYTSGGSSYQCTGTLLADRDMATTIPYFLSANHCISTQAVASTLQTWWFWRTTGCNGASTSRQTLAGGATLLYASSNTDTVFLQLNTTPPAGVMYAGWIVGSTPPLNSAVTGLHHPGGDPLKISFGNVLGYYRCFSTGGNQFSCESASGGTATFYAVSWSSGVTEPGSSGSAIFLNSGHYVIGQLYGGGSACGTTSPDFYGRFDVAYNAGISQWLAAPTPSYTLSVSRIGTGAGNVTSSPSGISCGSTCSASFPQGTSVTLTASPGADSTFSGWSGACSGTASTCTVTVNAATSVTANFTIQTYLLAVTRQGTGSGTVTSSPSGINCGSTCSANFPRQSTIALTAAAANGSAFTGWSGACGGTSATCNATLNGSTTAVATFSQTASLPGAPQNLTATPGNGMATFMFGAPTNTAGSVITEYRVTCTSGHTSTGNSSPIAITGLANGTSYSCSAQATNAAGNTSLASPSVLVTPSASAAMTLVAVRSRKFHGATSYDLPISLGAPFLGATVEPRDENTHRVIFSFSNPITFPGTLTITDASGTAVGAGSTVAASGSDVVVTLSNVGGMRVQVSLVGVNGAVSVGASIAFLKGAVRGEGSVTAKDILATKGRLGTASTSTFRYDVDRSGIVDSAGDLVVVRSQAGQVLQ